MYYTEDESVRAEEYAKWVIKNASSLMSMLDKEGEKERFLAALNKYVQEKQGSGVDKLPKYKVFGRKLVKR
jgi:hypothetical protein